MKTNNYFNFLSLNLGLLMISTSGVLGRPLEMAPEVSIFWRSLLASCILWLFIGWKKFDLGLKNKSDSRYIIIGGLLMAMHWVTYFYSLSLSSVAIAILTLHTFPAMTSILEPLILKTKFQFYHLLLAVLVILGIYIIAPPIDFSNKLFQAVLFGLVSAFAYAIRNIYTRKVMPHYHGSVMMFYQLVIMTVVLIPFTFFKSSAPLVTHDWPFILGLAFLTTAIGHTLLVVNLKHYSAITVSLTSSIIPVYGVILGYLFLNEMPSTNTLIGGSLILMSFVVEGYMSNRRNSKSNN